MIISSELAIGKPSANRLTTIEATEAMVDAEGAWLMTCWIQLRLAGRLIDDMQAAAELRKLETGVIDA